MATANTVSRRKALGIFGATLTASAVPVAVTAAAPANGENPRFLALVADLEQNKADLAKARDDLQWIADEWRHRWPLAPEELLGGANAHQFGGTINRDAERDITGAYLMRDRAPLTKRLSREFRAKEGQTCFAVFTSAECAERVAGWEDCPPRGRTDKARAMYAKHRVAMLAEWRSKLELSREYEAETARLRKLAGVEHVKDRIASLQKSVTAATEALMAEPAWTPEGLAMKARAFLSDKHIVGLIDCSLWPAVYAAHMARDAIAMSEPVA